MKKPTLVSISLFLSLAAFPASAAVGAAVGGGTSIGIGATPSVGVNAGTSANGGVSATQSPGTSSQTNNELTADHEDSTDMRYAHGQRHNSCASDPASPSCVGASATATQQSKLKANQSLQK